MDLIIAVDIGTGGVRAGIYDKKLDNKIIENVNYSTNYPAPSRAEQNPEEILSSVIKVINKAINRSEISGNEISYLTFDCSVHTILGLDKNLNPVTPALTWEDSRADSIINRWEEEEIGKSLYEKTGCPLHPLYSVGKIKWWKENKPELYKKIEYFVTLKSYVLNNFTDKLLEDPATVSGSGLLNIHSLDWEDKALELAGISKKMLPEIVMPDHMIEGINEAISKKTGLKTDIKVIIGSSDAAMSSLGSGTVEQNQMTVMIGTSGAIRRIVPEPKVDQKQRTFCYYLGDDKWFAGGAINNGGIVLDWYLDTFGDWAKKESEKEGVSPYTILSKEAKKAEPGSKNMLFLPFLAGERSPYWHGSMKGIISGISLSHEQSDFIRSLLEGICFRMYSVYLPLNKLISPPEEIRITGGFTRSSFWVQLLTDIFGTGLSVTEEPEGSVLGAAAFGLYSLGEIESLDCLKELNTVKETTTPDKKLHKYYKDKYDKSMDIYHKMKDEF